MGINQSLKIRIEVAQLLLKCIYAVVIPVGKSAQDTKSSLRPKPGL